MTVRPDSRSTRLPASSTDSGSSPTSVNRPAERTAVQQRSHGFPRGAVVAAHRCHQQERIILRGHQQERQPCRQFRHRTTASRRGSAAQAGPCRLPPAPAPRRICCAARRPPWRGQPGSWDLRWRYHRRCTAQLPLPGTFGSAKRSGTSRATSACQCGGSAASEVQNGRLRSQAATGASGTRPGAPKQRAVATKVPGTADNGGKFFCQPALPTPGSPVSTTIPGRPAAAACQRSRSSASSCSRPTSCQLVVGLPSVRSAEARPAAAGNPLSGPAALPALRAVPRERSAVPEGPAEGCLPSCPAPSVRQAGHARASRWRRRGRCPTAAPRCRQHS